MNRVKKDARIDLLIPQRDRDELEQLANYFDHTVSHMVRTAIKKYWLEKMYIDEDGILMKKHNEH